MPYIKKEFRNDITQASPLNVGELNWVFTEAWIKYLKDFGYPQLCTALSKSMDKYIDNKGLNYQTINDIIGAIECCKMEILRRRPFSRYDYKFIVSEMEKFKENVYQSVAGPYEDEKCRTNGDVY